MLRKIAVLAALLLVVAPRLFALGLGNVTVESALNQPLNARIELLQLGDVTLNQLSVQMASPADFQRFNIDRVSFLSDVRISIESQDGRNYVRLTSTQLVREPYLSFILDTRWPSGRILSEHTILLDLPLFTDGNNAPVVRQPISPVLQEPTTQPAQTTTAPPPTVNTPAVTPAPVVPQAEQTEPEPAPQVEPETVDEAVPETEQAANDTPAVEETRPEPVVDDIPEPTPAAPQPVAQTEPEIPDTLTTTSSDTLWDIALRVRPNDSVSIQQTMLALQRLNPDAFIGGNINMLRSGQVLRIPDLREIQSVDQQQAVAEVTRQNQQVAATDVEPLAAPATQAPATNNQSSGQLTVVTAEDTNAGGVGSALAEENAELDARIRALENQLAVREEEVDRARIEREELISRLDELDSQIASAMEIITLQDMQLAQLQESMAEAAAQAAAAQAAAPPPTPARSGGLLNDILGMLTSNLLVLGGGVAVVILGLVAILLRRNKGKTSKFDEDLEELVQQETGKEKDKKEPRISDAKPAAASKPAAKGKSDMDDELNQILSMSSDYDDYEQDDEHDPDEDVDAETEDSLIDTTAADLLDQADELLNAGKLHDAALLLQDAVAEDRNNVDLQLKLLEVYAEQDNDEAFAELAIELGSLESEEIASTIDSLRKRLSSEQAADAALGEAASDDDEEDSGSLLVPDADEHDDMDFDLDSLDDDDSSSTAVTAESDEEPESFDFNLSDLAEDDAPEAPAASEKTAPEEDDNSLDMTFEFEVGEAEPASAEPEPVSADSDEDEPEGFEFSLSPVTDAEPEASVASNDDEQAEVESFDFDLDAPTDRTVVEAKEEPSGNDDIEDFDFDLDAVDGDGVELLDDADDTAPPQSASADSDDLDDLEFISGDDTPLKTKDDDDNDLDFLSVDDEAATKLDLAYAYQKMGDSEGAREILEEVIKEGNEAQIKEAKTLLDSLG